MEIIVIDDSEKLQDEKKKQDKVPLIWFTTYRHTEKQKKREDKEPFYYLPSSKNQREAETRCI